MKSGQNLQNLSRQKFEISDHATRPFFQGPLDTQALPLCHIKEWVPKGTCNDVKNDVKNGYHEHPGKEILEKWSKNAFFPLGTLPKRWKMIIFWVYFCKSKINVPFCINISFILSFNFESTLGKMERKRNGKWLKNDWKMDQKCQLWTTLLESEMFSLSP